MAGSTLAGVRKNGIGGFKVWAYYTFSGNHAAYRVNVGDDITYVVWGGWPEIPGGDLPTAEMEALFGSIASVRNQPPVARCRQDIEVTTDPGKATAAVAAVDFGSYDPDGDPITVSQFPAGTYGLGVTGVSLTVMDDNGQSSSCDAKVTVRDKEPPVIVCSADTTVNTAPGRCDAVVVFESVARDNADPSPTIVSVPPSGTTFGKGATAVKSTAADASGNESACSFRVTVEDKELPVIRLKPAVAPLWSPNHKYATFTLASFVAGVTDNCETPGGGYNVVISQFTSDEPEDVAGNSDGATLKDIVIAADFKSVELRRERDGTKDGRVYKITLKIRDASGNIGQAIAKVTVPKSASSGPAVDSGVALTVNGGNP